MMKKELTNGWEEIITPYLDIHNDLISIYVKSYEGGYIISDQGYTIEDLEFSGCNINKSDNRKKLLQLALNSFGVQLNNLNELFIHANFESFSIKKHNFIQAILSITEQCSINSFNTIEL